MLVTSCSGTRQAQWTKSGKIVQYIYNIEIRDRSEKSRVINLCAFLYYITISFRVRSKGLEEPRKKEIEKILSYNILSNK